MFSTAVVILSKRHVTDYLWIDFAAFAVPILIALYFKKHVGWSIYTYVAVLALGAAIHCGICSLQCDWALDRFDWTMDVTPLAGGTINHDNGKCVWIWRRAGGSWKIARAIWNSDNASAGMWSGAGTPGAADEKIAITRLAEEYSAAVTEGDVQRWAATLSDDILFQSPDQPRASGKAAVIAWGKDTFFDRFDMRLSQSFEDIEVFGNSAFAHGRFTLELTPSPGGSATRTNGKSMNLFRRAADGTWKYARAGFSFDAPLSVAASR